MFQIIYFFMIGLFRKIDWYRFDMKLVCHKWCLVKIIHYNSVPLQHLKVTGMIPHRVSGNRAATLSSSTY
jgi:hypothetical protein